ncbi:TetR/AcrR family transcriptional regulator [Nocardioides humilatus]|uniref:TetR/AcrR family transcriptional regulator n=1 Tax=Nocardioides humilatus TaxID=2607660 RepID=A0A5B1LF12_9ACTN|nr:TetR/AcrR family transcriptional regulator [Nocardioides humilatus]KAA1419321.1 TetR/AcrR family transcriptional regulator [Nocardioides humilatus]
MTVDVQGDRRSRILHAAAQHFAEHPYEKVSTVAIAADAECNRGWIYHEFGSKRDLYLAVLQGTARVPALPPLTGLVVDSAGRDLAVAQVIDRWLDGVVATRDSFLALQRVHSGSHSDPVVSGVLREINEGTIDNVLATVVEDPGQVSPAARALVACFAELAWQALWEWLGSERLDRTQVHAVLTKSLISLLELVPQVAA